MSRIVKYGYMSLIYVFLYFPIVILIVYSLNDSRYSIVWHGLTSTWYRELWADTSLIAAALHSVLLGLSAALVACVVGTIGSICLYRYQFRGRQVVHALIFVVILVPDIIMGISLLILFNKGGMPLGFYSLLIAHSSICIPFVMVTIYSHLTRMDPQLLEAAADLGASDYQLLGRVLLPLLWPAMMASALLAFTLSFDDVIISYFTSGPDYEILPLKIYSLVRMGINPEVNALSSLMFVFTLTLVTVSQLLLRRKP
jgi:spermidine/putrescine transport system permease protein